MFQFKAGSTSKTIYVKLVDSTTFLAKTGLLYSDMTIYYTLARATALTTAPATLAAASSAWATGGFKEVDSTNAPGLYRFDVPDAALASGPFSVVTFKATATKDEAVLVLLPAYDPFDGVRLGLTALPNAAAGANTGLPVVGTQIPNATAGAVGGVFIAGTNAPTTITTALTANVIGNITGNLSGSAGSVTGAVGSVTGNVGGNVVGSVASVTATVNADIKKIDGVTITGSGVLGDEFKP